MKKTIYIIAFIILGLFAKPQANHLFGLGLGLGDAGFNFKNPPPILSDKDLNINYSVTWNYFALETRQGFRNDNFFFDAFKSSSYLLLGFSTLKDKRFSFNMLIGGVYSFISNRPGYTPYYPSQIKPILKTGFYLRIAKKQSLYLGLDALVSIFDYYYLTPSSTPTGGSRGITLSSLISINYLLLNKNKL